MSSRPLLALLLAQTILAACAGGTQVNSVPPSATAHGLAPTAAHATPPGHSTPTHAAFTSSASTAVAGANPRPLDESWLMFHRDPLHTGVTSGVGSIDPAAGPAVRWTFRVTAPPTEADYSKYRWYSSFPLGDLDGDGTLEVVVTTPDNTGEPDRVIALKDLPGGDPPVRALWTFTSPEPPGPWGFDQYSAALADADGDGLLDVFFSSKDGTVRALRGLTGDLVWEYDTGHFIEAGPMIADLDGDGALEVVITTDCQPGPECVAQGGQGGALYVFAANPEGSDPLLWSVDLPRKADSAEAAIADLDPTDGQDRLALVFGSWDGMLHVLWREADGSVVQDQFDLRSLEDGGHGPRENVVVRSTPLLFDFGEGWTAVFGWMPDWTVGTEARVSAIRIQADMPERRVEFTPLWTVSRDDWKSSVALLPRGAGTPLVVTGYGIGTTQGTGNYGACDPPMGGILAIDPRSGDVVWEDPFENEGNVRSSPAVADVDGDGVVEVILTVGCFGKIYAYDGDTGEREWGFQLGPRTIGSPSIGDLDGDGTLEIVAPSFDGQVWVLGGW